MSLKERLSNIKAIAFDLDGTIYTGDHVIDGAIDTVNHLKQTGRKVFYFTNNSGKTRSEIAYKLKGMGLDVSINEIYSSAYATANYLAANNYFDVYCIAANGLIQELKEKNINISDDKTKVKALIIGLDSTFNYNKLATVLSFKDSSCKIIACNRDKNYPIENGKFMPGCGPIVSAVEDVLDKKVNFIVGKPNTYMMEILTIDWGLSIGDILIVGDSYASDIEMAKRCECLSIMISKEVTIDIKDTIVVKQIGAVRDLFTE